MMKNNVMGLHTLEGCTQVSQNQSSMLINSMDYSWLNDYNKGCITMDPRTEAYGEAFMPVTAGGGMFLTEYAESGVL